MMWGSLFPGHRLEVGKYQEKTSLGRFGGWKGRCEEGRVSSGDEIGTSLDRCGAPWRPVFIPGRERRRRAVSWLRPPAVCKRSCKT